MFTHNPFAELSGSITPLAMQLYVVLMFLLVLGGTLLDTLHKKSAKYFFQSAEKSKKNRARTVGGGEKTGIAVKTVVEDVLMSAEFCNPRRRIAHLLGMYGFVTFIVTTVLLIFCYPTAVTPAPPLTTTLWHLGALMVCVGGYWFWFFIRVDVAAEGNSPFRIVRADLFILSLLASVTLGLIWAFLQTTGAGGTSVFLWLYILATTVLFGSIPWSKFSHMFFKPAAALQKRVENANGSRSNLPPPVDKPETLGSASTLPRHY